jgi:choline kinase
VVVILAAGMGTRLKGRGGMPKPLVPVVGEPLLRRVIRQFEGAGVLDVVLVLGHRAEEVLDAVEAWSLDAAVTPVINPKYRLSNGISVLAAREAVGKRPFFVSMADHIFEPSLIRGLMGADLPSGGLVLAVDRKLDAIFDMDDATKVLTQGSRIIEIGKRLDRFDAVDTGLFSCTPALFDAIEDHARRHPNGDSTLSQGVKTLTAKGLTLIHDIGDARWQDVDTPETARHAETLFG